MYKLLPILLALLLPACDDPLGLENLELVVEIPCQLPPEFCTMGAAHFEVVYGYAFGSMSELQRSEWVYMIYNPPEEVPDISQGFVSR